MPLPHGVRPLRPRRGRVWAPERATARRVALPDPLGASATDAQLSDRLAPNEDADALVHAAIETTIAGLRAGAALGVASSEEHT